MSRPRLIQNIPTLIYSELNKEIDGAPDLIFDWKDWGFHFTALVFLIVNTGAVDVTVTPEISPDQVHICTKGIGVPAALVVPAGEASADPYGVDLIVPYWRLWLSSAGGLATTCDVYVYGLPRTSMHGGPG